jgi:hypothetical protein
MLSMFCRLLAVLVAFALVGGTTAQFAQSGEYAAPMAMAGMPCDMMMPMAAGEHGEPMMPGKGTMPDCIKLCCMAVVALPAPLTGNEILTHFSMVDYWPAGSKLDGLARSPEPVPPRTT